MLDIPGNYLEGGGQILRTAVALSCIAKTPIRITDIRAKRKDPGLKPQHLHSLKALSKLFKAQTSGLELGSKEIIFSPSIDKIETHSLDIDIQTAGSIGLILQPLLLVSAFRGNGISFHIKGGTCGTGAVPIDYYSNVIIPTLSRYGLVANLKVLKRGYYPKGGGEVEIVIQPITQPKEILLVEPGQILSIGGISIASHTLSGREVAERQTKKAQEIIKKKLECPINIKAEYAQTFSPGSEINLYAYTEKGCILGSDSRGERGKLSEHVGREAAEKLLREIQSGTACDTHLTDNLIPWMSLLGGTIKTSELSLHTQTNIWVCELFFGKIFSIEGKTISVKHLVKPRWGLTRCFTWVYRY